MPVAHHQPSRAAFFDKDGTLIVDQAYNVDPAKIQFMPGAEIALWLLHDLGYRFFVISNQSGVARGFFPEHALMRVERRLREMFADLNVTLDGFYYCPHYPQGVVEQYAIECGCRKPAPGLLFRAANEHGIDLARSWVIGDILDDIQAGKRAGCKTILLDDENEKISTPTRTPDYRVKDLEQAAERILETEQALRSVASLNRFRNGSKE
jgi:D,D-heptose 1,7-bisphosphate phosphatase